MKKVRVGGIVVAFAAMCVISMMLGPEAVANPGGSEVANPASVAGLGSTWDVTVTNVGPGTGIAGPICAPCGWQTLSNAAGAIDGTLATTQLDDQFNFGDTEALGFSGFGFSIPTHHTITGVELVVAGDVIAFASGVGNLVLGLSADVSTAWVNAPGAGWEATIDLLHTGGPVFTTAGAASGNEVGWPHTGAGLLGLTTGGPADLWGAALTPAIVNSSTFGVVMQSQAAGTGDVLAIDGIQMTIFHVNPPPAPTAKPWVLVLMGTMLAFAAAVMIRRKALQH